MKVCSVCDRCFEDFEFYCSEAGHPPLEGTRRGDPEMVDGYHLDALLASGLKGDTYRAYHVASGRPCLIRLPNTDEKSRETFLAAANLAAAIFHPNLADVYESGTLETGECYVVAEDPAGQSLRDLLANVDVPSLLTSIQVVRQAAEAVHALHLKGMTHGALCPENIILTSDAEHRLLVRIQNPDFGGAEQNAIVFNKFFIDSALDSLRYFAPEQCSGELAGPKADIYSLGVILYEMLAGSPPFEASSSSALIEKLKNQRPPDIRIDNFDLRMLLTHTLMESLSKRPESRQSSANAFARQMRHIEQLATHVSTPPPVVAVAPPVRPSISASPVRGIVQPERIAEAADSLHAGAYNEYYGEAEFIPVPSAEIQEEQLVSSVYVDEIHAQRESDFKAAEDEPIASPKLVSEPIEERPGSVVVTSAKNLPEESSPSRLKLHRRKLHALIAPLIGGDPDTTRADNASASPTTSSQPNEIVEPAEAAARSEELAPAPIALNPVKIEWEQPEDDIPSMADTAAVLSDEGAAIPAIAQPEAVPASPVRFMEPPKVVETKKPAPRTVPAETVKTAIAAPARAPRRRPTAIGTSQTSPREAVFFPTILGNTGANDVYIPDAGGGILSAYSSASAARFSIPNRGLVIGSGAIVLIGLYLFGSGIIGRFASIETTGDSVAAKSASTAAAMPDTVRGDADPETTTRNSSPEIRDAEPVRTTRIETKEPAPRPIEPRRDSPRPNERKTQANRAPALADKSRETKNNPAPPKAPVDKAPSPKPVKIAGATRPRIVKDSSP